MFCPNCGAPTSHGAKFCEHCGQALNSAAAPPAVRPHSPIHVPTKLQMHLHMPKNPLTIDQTMKIFCILLIAVIPAIGFYQQFVRGLSDAYGIAGAGQIAQIFNSDNKDQSSSANVGKDYLELYTLRIALSSPIFIFSVYTGLLLWNRRPGALELSKKFLIVLFTFLVCSHLIFPHFFGITETYDGTLSAEFWLSLIFLAACYYALRVSKQVHDFYQAVPR